MTTAEDAVFIDTAEGLRGLCDLLRQRPYIAVDTEFLRERTYRPELCLVQIKHQELLACIDTLAIDDLQVLVDLLLDEQITKVFHAASQDLEIFYLLCKAVPKPIFDTQLAAPLLGYNEQIGYANLVEKHLQISLDKSHTRADWKRRPLPASQLAYALDDVIYLEQLYVDMREQLDKLGRLEWLEPEFRQWEEPAKYDQPAGERWKKIRNIQRFKGASLAIIQHLARWREIKARELNQPRNWIIKDDVLLSIAQQKPANATDLKHIRGLERKSQDRFGLEILDIVQSASKSDPQPLPAIQKKEKLSPGELAQLHLLNAWVHQRASELNIAPGLLAPQKLLEHTVRGDSESALAGWREPLLGKDLNLLLQGRASLLTTKTGLSLKAVD